MRFWLSCSHDCRQHRVLQAEAATATYGSRRRSSKTAHSAASQHSAYPVHGD